MEQENNVVNETTNEETFEPLTFDEILSDSEYQREFDKRVAKALDTAKTKWQAEADEKRSEAEKLASMKEAERQAYELEKSNKARDEALAKLNAYELRNQANSIANEYGVDSSLLDLINFNSIKAEDVEPQIKKLKGAMDKAVERMVNEKLREETPRNVDGGTHKNTTDLPNMF